MKDYIYRKIKELVDEGLTQMRDYNISETKYQTEFMDRFSVCVLKSLSHGPLFVTPGTVAHQAPLSMGFPRQEYWSGLPFPPPGGSS